MKKIFTLTSFFTLLACSSAPAIDINAVSDGECHDGRCRFGFISDRGIYALYLEDRGTYGEFDSIDLSIAGFGAELLNPDSGLDGFVPRGPGEPFTYINALLTAPTAAPGGLGWSLVGNRATALGVRVAGGPLGRDIETPPAPGIFLANVMLPVGEAGWFSATFVNDGVTIRTLTVPFPGIPEPSCLILFGVGLLGLACTRHPARSVAN